ncbi:hypothetical protein ACFQ3P_13490 [Paraburkholderia sabiae]|jgi:hypothetical protein|uniref:DUF4148 domain-containing protein n=1 Tax=Paraburkholderia sabiae TaxID=273251 RepID=A0ABU9QCZ0_9BURK|nr:hypothetical protein [Paraburkholderia sabiae]WJZ76112.1 hypothetical protein QEN71_10030 [Paraburkholderia sabiae]CAD6526575.1 hypothetical protein LMG24235_01966 [Paraburkholderia sabiae]CAG9196343.1 conserved exported hypothetical protein [Paraburkholderia sabiae]
MKTLRIAATCAVALSTGYLGHAWAQDQPAPTQAAQAAQAQDVGGMPDASIGQSGHAMGTSRGDVYQDLVRFEQSGEQHRLNGGLYRGK